MRILFRNIDNNRIFSVKFLNEFCKKVNKETKILDFFAVNEFTTPSGLKNVLIRSRYKHNNQNTICKVLLFENSKGDLKLSIRKGFMISFVNDLQILKNYINTIKR